jgi:K+-transporting ATPase KdpF subunit
MRRHVTLPDDCLVRSCHGFHLCGFDSAVRGGESVDGRGLRSPEGKEMNGILIAGALVAVGLLIYLLVALFNPEDFS